MRPGIQENGVRFWMVGIKFSRRYTSCFKSIVEALDEEIKWPDAELGEPFGQHFGCILVIAFVSSTEGEYQINKSNNDCRFLQLSTTGAISFMLQVIWMTTTMIGPTSHPTSCI